MRDRGERPRREESGEKRPVGYGHVQLAAPRPHARTKPFRSGRPSAPATARFETTVWTMADSRKPKASGHRTSHSMKSEICRACRIALTTNKADLAPD